MTVGLRHIAQLNPSSGVHSGSVIWSESTETVNISPGHKMVSVTESGIAGGTTLIRIESLEMHALLELVRIYRVVSCKVNAAFNKSNGDSKVPLSGAQLK